MTTGSALTRITALLEEGRVAEARAWALVALGGEPDSSLTRAEALALSDLMAAIDTDEPTDKVRGVGAQASASPARVSHRRRPRSTPS